MKKLLALLLALVMILSLAACGDNAEVEDDDEKKPSATEAKGEKKDPTEDPAEDPTEKPSAKPAKTEPKEEDSDFDELMDILDEYEDLVDDAYEAAEDGDYDEYADILDEIDELGANTYELYAAGNYSDDEKEILDERVAELDARLDAIEFEGGNTETSSDYETMLELVAEYNAIIDDTIELVKAEGINAQSPEITARSAAFQEKLTAFQADNDLTAEQELEFKSLIQEAVERLYANIG